MVDVPRREYGLTVLLLAGLFLLYYTVWVVGLPFVHESYLPTLQRFFPPQHLALSVPLCLGSSLSLLLFARAYFLVYQDRKLDPT